jgi:hypothetical protein
MGARPGQGTARPVCSSVSLASNRPPAESRACYNPTFGSHGSYVCRLFHAKPGPSSRGHYRQRRLSYRALCHPAPVLIGTPSLRHATRRATKRACASSPTTMSAIECARSARPPRPVQRMIARENASAGRGGQYDDYSRHARAMSAPGERRHPGAERVGRSDPKQTTY